MSPLPLRSTRARFRPWSAGSAFLLFATSLFAAHRPAVGPPAAATRIGPARVRGSLVGHYVLRMVNDEPLPATLAGDDPYHTLQVTGGTLDLNPDGSYGCRTIATDIHSGIQEAFADTLLGGYTILSPSTIQLNHGTGKPDTIATSGFQITWAHPVRKFQGLFLYSR